MENIYVQFDGMIYQQIVGIPMGTNCASLIADLFLYCYERDFISNLQKSKRFDLIDKFNDVSRYIDDMFIIDNPDFAEHIPDIYPRELRLNKGKYTCILRTKKHPTQPDVIEKNDSEKITDLIEITSSQVFAYLSRWNFDDIRLKQIIFYTWYSVIAQMPFNVKTLNVSRWQTKLILQKI